MIGSLFAGLGVTLIIATCTGIVDVLPRDPLVRLVKCAGAAKLRGRRATLAKAALSSMTTLREDVRCGVHDGRLHQICP